MPFLQVHTKFIDLSNFIIRDHCHMAWNFILYLIATWPSPNLFFTRQKMDFCKIIFIRKFLMKIKGVHFSFFIFSRLLMMTFSFLQILNFNNFVVDKSSKNSTLNWPWVSPLYKHLMWCTYNFEYEWQSRTFTATISLSR